MTTARDRKVGKVQMAKHRATAENAVTHGIFRQYLPPAQPSPFAALAVAALPGPPGEDMAEDLMRAECQTARCRATLLAETRALEALLAAPSRPNKTGQAEIDMTLDMFLNAALTETLRKLTRLLRYQNQSLTALRKTRIAILNAAERIPARRKTPRG